MLTGRVILVGLYSDGGQHPHTLVDPLHLLMPRMRTSVPQSQQRLWQPT